LYSYKISEEVNNLETEFKLNYVHIQGFSLYRTVNIISLLLHCAFWRFAEYYTPTNA